MPHAAFSLQNFSLCSFFHKNAIFLEKQKNSKYRIIDCFRIGYQPFKNFPKKRGGTAKNAACCVALHLLERWLSFAGASAFICCCVGRRSALRFRLPRQAFGGCSASVYLCSYMHTSVSTIKNNAAHRKMDCMRMFLIFCRSAEEIKSRMTFNPDCTICGFTQKQVQVQEGRFPLSTCK